MIFIVDSGSTKTDWIALNEKGNVLFSTQTLGLNPQVLPSTILTERIINNYDLYQNRQKVSHIYFYGAGCGVDTPVKRIEKVFKDIFTSYPTPPHSIKRSVGFFSINFPFSLPIIIFTLLQLQQLLPCL